MIKKIFNKFEIWVAFSLLLTCFVSCEEFLEADIEKSQIIKQSVFSNDITATAAVTSIYSNMYANITSFASGSYFSITGLCGMSADEFNYYPISPDFKAFEQNSLTPLNLKIFNIWKSMYFAIYEANSALDGLENSVEVTSAVKDQLKGEALFIRAFTHFYLVNLFGDVPIVTTIDYRINEKISKQPISAVYEQVVVDLIAAQTLLSNSYPTAERTRPNKSTVTALLARVYLYTKEWENAESQASSIINNTNYILLSGSEFDNIFVNTSMEAIWQLRPSITDYNTNEANTFILAGLPNSSHPFVLDSNLVQAFEPNDIRKAKWVNSIGDFYYPFKYKKGISSSLTEYSIVFRLAEQYLIRAEARAQQGKLTGTNSAESDINAIRFRAGLLPTSASTQSQLFLAIEQERRIELFSEWGHRWFDLKRWNITDAILSPLKTPNWQSTDDLYPIPQSEIDKNPNLVQNSGY